MLGVEKGTGIRKCMVFGGLWGGLWGQNGPKWAKLGRLAFKNCVLGPKTGPKGFFGQIWRWGLVKPIYWAHLPWVLGCFVGDFGPVAAGLLIFGKFGPFWADLLILGEIGPFR